MAWPAVLRVSLFFRLAKAHSSGNHNHEHVVPGLSQLRGAEETVDVAWSVSRRLDEETKNIAFPEELEAVFRANGSEFRLILRKNSKLLPKSARHVMQRANGAIEEGPLPTSCFYQGEVSGDETGRVGVSICDGGLRGLVLAHGRFISLQPMLQHGTGGGRGLRAVEGHMKHVAVRITDEGFHEYLSDVSKFAHPPVTPERYRKLQQRVLTGSSTKYVEVLVVNDNSRYRAFGGTASGIVTMAQESAAVMNLVTTIYRTPPNNGKNFPYTLQLVMVGQHTFTEKDPWEDTVKAASGVEVDTSNLLELFSVWGRQHIESGLLPACDNRALFSGRDFDGNTVGLAYMSTMCAIQNSAGINMVAADKSSNPNYAAVVAHEMGHNFGMQHDSTGNACPQSGFIMEAVGNSQASSQFSSCSVTYIEQFFQNAYVANGECLENLPTTVFGDPVCGNGLVEGNESCDCGGISQCNDPCCNATTCAFSQPQYQCSGAAGTCCENCMVVKAEAAKMCRAARNECDLPEYCIGNSPKCPTDGYYYPGKSCQTHGFPGSCSAGMCHSLQATCATVATNLKPGTFNLNENCAKYNDQCGPMVCHNATSSDPYACYPSFILHNKHLSVPEGSPCWFPGDPEGVRNGVCQLGKCKMPHALAEVPLCGNGGIDYGEECDCGGEGAGDTCCDCNTCKLQGSAQCSTLEPCCNNATCTFHMNGTVCRPALGECDVAEICSGASGVCPSDVGAEWSTLCNGGTSTCYGKVCLDSLDKQCEDLTCRAASSLSCRKSHRKKTNTGKPETEYLFVWSPGDDDSACQALSCCTSQSCTASKSSSSHSINGVVHTTIYAYAAKDGTVVANPNKMCDGYPNPTAITPNKTCTSGTYYQVAVGKCVACDSACTKCTGPAVFDCVGPCKHGPADSRGACPISKEQVAFANQTRIHYVPPNATPAMPMGPGGTTPGMPMGPGGTTPGMPMGPGGTTPGMLMGPGGTTPGMPMVPGGTTPAMPKGPGGTTPGMPMVPGGTTPGMPMVPGGTTPAMPMGPGGTTPGMPKGPGGATPDMPTPKCLEMSNAKINRISEKAKEMGFYIEVLQPPPESCK